MIELGLLISIGLFFVYQVVALWYECQEPD